MAEAVGISKVAFKNVMMAPTTTNPLDFLSGDLKKKHGTERPHKYNW